MYKEKFVRYINKYPRLKKIAKVVLKFLNDDVPGLTAELTFYLITSFFPFAILLLSLISITPLSAEDTIYQLFSALPQDVYDIIFNFLTGITISPPIVIFSTLLAMWSLSGAVSTISKALNRMYGAKETRNQFIIRSIGALFAFLLALTIVLAFSTLILGNIIGVLISRFFPSFNVLWHFLRIVFMFFVMFCVFASLYKILPDKKLRFKNVFIGAISTTLLWSGASIVFSFYIDNFSKHHIIYGSIAGVLVLVTWLYMSSFIILSGGEINALIHHKMRSTKSNDINKS